MGLVNSSYIMALDLWMAEHDSKYVLFENSDTNDVEAYITCRWGDFKVIIDETESADELIKNLDERLANYIHPKQQSTEQNITRRQWVIMVFYLDNRLTELTVNDFGSTQGTFWYQMDDDDRPVTYHIPLTRIEKVVTKEVGK